jgi:biopolymer transport protein TolR
MAGTIGRLGHIESEPNVLPMIDVLLVLLIIFLLNIRHVLDFQIPEAAASPSLSPPAQIVLEILADGRFELNGQPVPDDRLEPTLEEIYRPRTVKILFIKASPRRKYHEVVATAGRSKGAGVQVIALIDASVPPASRTAPRR